MHILVAEDDQKLLKALVHLFKINNYLVDGVDNGRDALDYAMTGEYDGLILDVMMPVTDGLTVLKKLRECGITTPALFLTARGEVYQRVEGLDAGADDYLPKPFSTSELLARVRAMLRRKDNYTPELINVQGLSLNCSTYELCYGDKKLTLSGKEFQVCELLMRRAPMLVSTEQLMTSVWGWDTEADTSVVWVNISNIRKKLEALSAPIRIRFVRNGGYVIEVGE